jgi:hypothetical protein
MGRGEASTQSARNMRCDYAFSDASRSATKRFDNMQEKPVYTSSR